MYAGGGILSFPIVLVKKSSRLIYEMGKPEINLLWNFSVNVAFLNLHDKMLLRIETEMLEPQCSSFLTLSTAESL